MAVKQHRLDIMTFRAVYNSGLKRGVNLNDLARECGLKNATGLANKVTRLNDWFESQGQGRPFAPCPTPPGKRSQIRDNVANIAAEIRRLTAESGLRSEDNVDNPNNTDDING